MIKFIFPLFFCLLNVIYCDQLKISHNNNDSRFLQSKTNVLTWITNVLFPSQSPEYFKKFLDYRGCREYFSKPSDNPIDLNTGWLQTENWEIDNETAVIEYRGKEGCREPTHSFPFGWLDNRMSTRSSLIKKDFFCKKTIAQMEVQMNDAQSCGFIFRVIGERNYWALLIDANVLKLIRVINGEFILIKAFPELKIQKDKWYVLFVQELIKDVKIKAGEYGNISVEYLKKSTDESEYMHKKQGSVGLLANKGNCKFRNIILRGKKWSSEYEKLKKGKGEMLFDMQEINQLYAHTKDWCPSASLCAKAKYEIIEEL